MAVQQSLHYTTQALLGSVCMHGHTRLLSKNPAQMIQRRADVSSNGFESDILGQLRVKIRARFVHESPLPDGRSIPVTMKSNPVNDDMANEQREANRLTRAGNRDLINELRRLRSDVSGLHDHNTQLERMLSRLLAGRATAGRAA